MNNTTHQHGRYGALWELTEGHRIRYSAAIAVMFVAIAFTFTMPLIVKWCIDGIVEGEFAAIDSLPWLAGFSDYNHLGFAALAVILAAASSGALTYLRGRWAAIASQAITRALRDRLFSHLEHLPASFHDRSSTGDLIQRCSSDVETVRIFLAGQIVEIARTVMMVATVAPVLFWLDTRLAMVSLVMMPLIFLFAFRFFTKVKDLFQKRDEAEAAMSARLQENLTGIRVVRAFSRQDYEIERFARTNKSFRDHDQRLNVAMANFWTLSDLLSMAQMGIVLIAGAHWMMTGDIGVGTLFAFYTYVGMVIWPIRHLGRVLQDVGKAIVALGRLNHILEEPEESSHEKEPNQAIRGDIRISGLNFGFESQENVLKDISLHIRAGETVAILGPPGCGKTTLVQLLMRLYDYHEGSIQLDDMELSTIPRKTVRSHIGIVMQDPFLYSRSIRDNLRVGKDDATDEELRNAAAEAAIDESIERFKDGLGSMVGERGVTLSGGQRQRMALARALLREPAILILDDALSAVDTGTEQRILESLRKRKGRATTIMIAHRLSTIVDADRVVVMDDGRIVQVGSHAQLLKSDGPYRRLCVLQESFETALDQDLHFAAKDDASV